MDRCSLAHPHSHSLSAESRFFPCRKGGAHARLTFYAHLFSPSHFQGVSKTIQFKTLWIKRLGQLQKLKGVIDFVSFLEIPLFFPSTPLKISFFQSLLQQSLPEQSNILCKLNRERGGVLLSLLFSALEVHFLPISAAAAAMHFRDKSTAEQPLLTGCFTYKLLIPLNEKNTLLTNSSNHIS